VHAAGDEVGALVALKHHFATLFNPAVTAHKGRVVRLVGDGVPVEFRSVIDAVNCGLAVLNTV
jgi:adenylate cyclase